MAAKKKDKEAEMSLMGHLNELRVRLFRAAFAIAAAATICFIYSRVIFDNVILAPKSSNFITYQWFCKLSQFLHIKSLCFGTFDYTVINLQMSGQFMTDMYVSLFAGIIISFPYVLLQIWNFIKPALHENERRYSRGAVGVMSVLFIIGILFGYYIIVPLSINFLGTYQVSGTVANQFQLDSYISTITTITFGMGVVFELPVFLFFLSKIGILSPEFMRKTRKYAFLIIVIVAAIITPPDVVSQMMVTIPLYGLYEIGILFAAKAAKDNKKVKE